jgi:DNA-binding NarL/FixJ family response regulator
MPALPSSGSSAGPSIDDRIAMAQAGVPLPAPAAAPAVQPAVPALAKTVSGGQAAGAQIAGDGVTDVAELARLLGLIRQTEAVEGTAQRSIVIGEFSVLGNRVPESLIGALQSLSRNEAAVLRFLGWGRSNTDIAMLMNCNDATVRTHMNNAIRKLEMDGVRELNSVAGLLFHPVD